MTPDRNGIVCHARSAAARAARQPARFVRTQAAFSKAAFRLQPLPRVGQRARATFTEESEYRDQRDGARQLEEGDGKDALYDDGTFSGGCAEKRR